MWLVSFQTFYLECRTLSGSGTLCPIPRALEIMKTDAQIHLEVSKAPQGNSQSYCSINLSESLFSLNLGALCVFYFIASSSMHLKGFTTKTLQPAFSHVFSGRVGGDTGFPNCGKWKSPFNVNWEFSREEHNLQHFPNPFDPENFLLRKILQDEIPHGEILSQRNPMLSMVSIPVIPQAH